MIEMYAAEQPLGLFKGFSPSPRELNVEVIVPHGGGKLPSFGEFILIEMAVDQAAVGRVIHYHPTGPLTSKEGESYMAEMGRDGGEFPEEVRELVLRYSMTVGLLGVLILEGNKLKFEPGARSLANLGKHVRRPSLVALKYLSNVDIDITSRSTVEFGHLVLGSEELKNIKVHFDIERLKAKRTFVFARAGYGKSNLIKYLLAALYRKEHPDVGLLIFDPEGEYALPQTVDDREIPGLASLDDLRKNISHYTLRPKKEGFEDVHRGSVKVNFHDFTPRAIITAFVNPEKHYQVWSNWTKRLNQSKWSELVKLLARRDNPPLNTELCKIFGWKPKEDGDNVSLDAIRNNLIPPIDQLHDPDSSLAANILDELKEGRIIIVDISLLSGDDGLAIAGLLMQKIFMNNLQSLTGDKDNEKIKTIVVLEEAQTILGGKSLSDNSIFVRWVKEGRKYDLGAILITQQPGAIAQEILSQGDNFFVMHLLNQNDLDTLHRVNAHYTLDILDQIRNEPIKGNCFFWTAPKQPYVISARVRNFDNVVKNTKDEVTETDSRKKTADTQNILHESFKHVINTDRYLFVYKVKDKNYYAISYEYLKIRMEVRLLEISNIKSIKDKTLGELILFYKLKIGYKAVLKEGGEMKDIVILPIKDWHLKENKKVIKEIDVIKTKT